MELGEHEYLAREGDRDWWHVGVRACTLALLPPLSAGAALDLGAGSGYFVRELAARGLDARGVELSEYAVAQSARIAPGRVEQGRLQDRLTPGLGLELVSCLDVLPHVEVDEDATLRTAAAALRPGGRLLLRLPAYRRLYGHHDRYVHQRRRYDRGDVAPLAAVGGFEVERVTFANCAMFGVVLAVRVAERLRERVRGAAEAASSSNQRYPDPVNSVLKRVLLSEAAMIQRGANLPWGSSLLVLLRRPER